MSELSGDRRDAALELIEAEPVDPTLGGVVRTLDRLCRAVTHRLDIRGAVVRLAGAGETPVALALAGTGSALADIEVTAGEGPGRTAHLLRRPVLVADLHGPSSTEWPGFRTAAAEAGVAAVFAVPLHIGAVGFGTLELFADVPGPLSREDLSLVLAFAEVAAETLLDGDLTGPDGRLSPSLARAFDHHAEIAQAQGMVMVDLGVPLAEAMVRLRAHAFARGETLVALARRVVDGYSIPSDVDG